MPSRSTDIAALNGLIKELDLVLKATTLPKTIEARAKELMASILALSEDLKERRATAYDKPAAILGSRGGVKTAERGSEYYAKIAAMRKTKAGGRPRKEDINKL